MAYSYFVNQYYQSTPDFFFRVRQRLVARGWTSPRDSDGTTYSSSGAQLTNSNLTVAGSLWNANAWFELVHPTGLCSFLIQKGATNATTTGDYWIIWYTQVGFLGGSPSATVLPTATDQIQICGTSGTNMVFGETDLDYRADLIMGGADENYSWYVQQRPIAYGGGTEVQRGNTVKAYLGFEAVLDPDPSDPSPYLCLAGISQGIGNTYDMFEVTSDIFRPDVGSAGQLGIVKGAVGRYRHGLEGQQWARYALTMGGQAIASNAQLLSANKGSASPFSQRGTAMSMYWMRGGSARLVITGLQTASPAMAYKGRSRFLKYFNTYAPGGGFTLPQKRYAQFTSIIIPWDGSSVVR